ncbi:MAG: ABC transporter ATP-binding protein [Nitrospirae bacterium]|nr:ABC transporter ATP-binding protein [Nitrospirota bacterium]
MTSNHHRTIEAGHKGQAKHVDEADHRGTLQRRDDNECNDKVIELKDIRFSYGNGNVVLEGVNFQLLQGQRIGLTGSNGSGKTTLFHVIMGLLKPQSGEVTVFGKKRLKQEDFIDVRRRIGLLFQDSDDQLFCPTVLEDVAFGPLNLGMTHAEAMRVVTETCDLLGLSGFEDRLTHRLSGGEKRLCALATIAAMTPEVLLLDEPTAGLDADSISRIVAFLNNYSMSHVIISHEIDFLKEVTDGVFVLGSGNFHALDN